MLKIKNAVFIKSIGKMADRPRTGLPEFAFAGRSNVGKSSLINTLLSRKSIAHVSKSPGKTRSINYILVNDILYFVDLPGYGFAKVSQAEKKRWQVLIEKYLVTNEQLKIVYILIDSKVGFKESDLQLIEFLHHHQLNYELILTKTDKIGIQMQKQRVNDVLRVVQGKEGQGIHLFSAKSRSGVAGILNSIHDSLKS